MATKKTSQVKLTLVRSMSGRLKAHQACVRGLGIRRMHHSVVVNNTPENRGMIAKVSYLLKIEDA
jgi:large subunit ribosomal protein L30